MLVFSRRLAGALLTAATLLAACGSDATTKAAAPAPAGAKENATAAAGCTDWSSGAAIACAVDARGPGGGRIFHDAGSAQPWGRYLEVAPQNWNGTLLDCPGSGMIGNSCGAADGVPKQTSDVYLKDGDEYSFGLCTLGSAMSDNTTYTIAGAGGGTGTALGAGRANTAALLASPECTITPASPNDASAFQKAAAYRGGGLDDWFIASKDELYLLCKYSGRNAIGGFPAKWSYISSSTLLKGGATQWWQITFDGNADCASDQGVISREYDPSVLTRPIRAF